MSILSTKPAIAIAMLLGLSAVFSANASTTMTNPVTGAEETYKNTFTGGTDGTGTEWDNADNWDRDTDVNAAAPYISGNANYNASLVDGKTASTATPIDGWVLRVGAYNKAAVTFGSLSKIQTNSGSGAMWITVDDTSSITINGWGNGNLGNNGLALNYYVAANNGVTWTVNLANGSDLGLTMNYYLAKNGSVSYKALERCAHVIKQADVTLTGTSRVSSKTLVSFSSTTKTFTAAADVKVYDADGTTLKKVVAVTSVRSSGATIGNTTSALTTSDAVGSCEIVQCTDGIVLYYVDGDTDAVTGYKPSININFTNGSGNGLTTSADVGLAGYAVPGTSWNNFVVANNTTYSTVNAVDSTGVASVASGVSVTVSGTRGHWNCSNLTPASNPLHGYIDESTEYPTPTVTITGIPYERYRVIVYHSTDQNGAQFGYDTINGFNFTYVNGVQQTGTASWGSAGAANSAEAIAEGVNTLVSAVLSGDTVTMVAHRIGGGSPTARGCFAAIQVVEYVPEVGENDLEIEVNGATSYSVDEAKTLSGTVYLTGSGTLTLAGSEKITAATIDVGKDVVLNINADRLDATTFTGSGTVVYDTNAPVEGKGWAAIGWSGTVWVKNQAVSAFEGTKFGNARSTVRFTGVTGYLQTSSWNGSTYVHTVPLELVDEGNTVAFTYNNGWGGHLVKINTLKGTGTLKTQGSGAGEHIYIVDASGFTGVFNLTTKSVYVGGNAPAYSDATYQNGKLEIRSGVTMTVPSSKTWTANSGFVVNSTLNVDGTLASSHTTKAVSGAGTVVFTGRAPTPTGDAWWKNASWAGTVWIKSHAIEELDTNLYGNEGSTLKFTGVTGYFAQNHVNTVPIELENNGSTVAFNYNYGWGGELLTFSELKGTGTLQTSSAGDGGTIWVKKWDAFTGVMNLGKKQVVMGGSEPAHDNVNRGGKLIIAEGAVVTNLNATTSWTASGGIEVNGTFAASDRTAWADGTAMTVNSTGILNMYGRGINDTGKSFANVTGTGTIWYSQTSSSDNTKYSTLPSSAANMFANTLSVSNDNSVAGVVITMNGASDVVTTNANVSGTGWYRSDWNSGVYRGFLALQSKNTTWSGTFGSSSRIKKFIVAGVDGATDRTLTLAGTQSSTIPLTVESLGSVNITGTYLGATTVSGEIGGTGTLTGNLTFNAGATFKVFDAAGDGTADTDADGLNVNGAVTVGDSGTVTVTIADGASIASETVILTATSISGTFTLDSSLAVGYELTVGETTLTIAPKVITGADGTTVVGYMNGTTAVITNTSAAVTIPDGATAITVYLDGGNPVLSGSMAMFTQSMSSISFRVKYGQDGNQLVTGAFPLITALAALGSYTQNGDVYTFTFPLNPNGTVYVGNENIAVTPALDTSATPIAAGTSEASFTVKTIPGLYYAVGYGSDNITFKAQSGTVKQATSTTTTLTAPTGDFSGIRYYKIQVGVSSTDFEVYPAESE